MFYIKFYKWKQAQIVFEYFFLKEFVTKGI
nr:hypothetical protein [Mucilaginibacter sp. X4EP1]